MPCGRYQHKFLEDQPACMAAFDAAFRMPLQPQHKMPGLHAFNRLHNGVLRASRYHSQSVADDSNRLMMAGIDR